jgi:hypothetical protein
MTRSLRDAVFASFNSVSPLPEQDDDLDDCDQALFCTLADEAFGYIRE